MNGLKFTPVPESIETRLDAHSVQESESRRIVSRGLRKPNGGFHDATGSWAGWDAEGGRDGSGIVHDAVFVFGSSIIMDNDTATIHAISVVDSKRRPAKAQSL
jgi:hypothetical protein